MAEQDADLLKVLVGQVSKDRDIDSILGKALGVAGLVIAPDLPGGPGWVRRSSEVGSCERGCRERPGHRRGHTVSVNCSG